MKFDTDLDRRIFKTIQGRAASTPQTLVGIIGGVDASERLVLSHEELSGGLRRLIGAGLVAETAPHRFCDAANAAPSAEFSGVTEPDHARAVRDYRDWFRRQPNRLDDESGEEGFVRRKLVLRWATPGGRWPTDDDEDGAEALAAAVDPLLARSGLGEVNGFEHGRGCIDVLIFGTATDADVDQIYDLIAPAFRAFRCPAGSRIVRVYQERNEALESDIVPDEPI